MAKLKLDLQQLHVQSFSPLATPVPRMGTVRANEGTIATCDTSPECETWFAPTCRHAETCNGADSCWETCASCGASCPRTCFEETPCIQCAG